MPSQKSYRLIMLFLTVALVVTSVVALCIGRYSIDPADAFGAVGSYLHKIIADTGEKPTAMENVVFVLRIPRIIGAIVIGAALSLSMASPPPRCRNCGPSWWHCRIWRFAD